MRADEPCVHEQDATLPLIRFFFRTGLPCSQCEAEEHAAWVEAVRGRLAAGLEAAAVGEPFRWDTQDPGGPRFALARLDDRIDLALTIDDDGRAAVPASARFDFGRVSTFQEAADAERAAHVLRRVREGVMTLEQARAAFAGSRQEVRFDTEPFFPGGIGHVLHEWLNPAPEPGPPYTHTFRPPSTEYDEDNNPIRQPVEPTHTITVDAENRDAR